MFKQDSAPVHKVRSITTQIDEFLMLKNLIGLNKGLTLVLKKSLELNTLETASQAYLSNISVWPKKKHFLKMVKNSNEQTLKPCAKPSLNSCRCYIRKGWADIYKDIWIRNGMQFKLICVWTQTTKHFC